MLINNKSPEHSQALTIIFASPGGWANFPEPLVFQIFEDEQKSTK
jgi:hypothetical protein